MGLAARGPGTGTVGLRRLGSGCGSWRRCGGWFGWVEPGRSALCWVCGSGRLRALGVGGSRGGSCGGRRPQVFGLGSVIEVSAFSENPMQLEPLLFVEV